MKTSSISHIEGIKIGQAESAEGVTGVTVILAEKGITAGVDVRGSAPGTRETDLLRPTNLVDKVHAVFLAGGSAFGLDAATGIVRYLDEQGIGFDTGYAKVPIVTGAILFDLGIGNPKIRPDADMGYQAAKTAQSNEPQQGNVGAGMGATAGKFLGEQYAVKSGVGVSAFQVDHLVVGSIIAANPFGEILDPRSGKILAGAYDRVKKRFYPADSIFTSGTEASDTPFLQNTTIGVVITNAKLNKTDATKISEMAHSGISRTIRPAHTMVDGDALFTLASGEIESDLTLIGHLAALSVEKSIVNAAAKSESMGGYPAHQDLLSQ